jgi:hypothetical protein
LGGLLIALEEAFPLERGCEFQEHEDQFARHYQK